MSAQDCNTGDHANPPQSNQTANGDTAARTARNAQADGSGNMAEHGAAPGASPSNTAPANSNVEPSAYFKALRWGVDSLYLSYRGDLFPKVVKRLDTLKQLAQSTNPKEVGQAQYASSGHIFEVRDRGSKVYQYVLDDGAFRIQLAKPGGTAPMAYIKVSAEYLANYGPEQAERTLFEILSEMGDIRDRAQVSRVDLYVDFESSENMESWTRDAWVTRAGRINSYAVGGSFSGWSVGLGGHLGARLYNKVLEIAQSGKQWVLPLWLAQGWKPLDPVWRLEFEFKREFLIQKNLRSLSDVLEHCDGLWSYATTEWLRLTLPTPHDKTRSRWPIHPLWGYLSSVDWPSAPRPLGKRQVPERSPHDDRLFSMLYTCIISFMAKHGFSVEDFDGAIDQMLSDAECFHSSKATREGISFDRYIDEKLGLKRRAFNSGMNKPDAAHDWEAQEQAERAAEYRKLSRGE